MPCCCKTLEPDQGEVHLVKDNQKRPPKLGRKGPNFMDDKNRVLAADHVRDASHRKKPISKEFVTCKFCGNKHKKLRDKCPAFGKRCLSCKKMNHFSSLVTAQKPNGQLRVCLDAKDLNEALRRSHYPTPTIDEILPELGRAKVFSTVDVKNGFWHVELTDESSMLTTFNSPFGRFRWCRLPFGVSPAPEEFQQSLNQALEDLKGVLPIHDEILIYGAGATEEEALQDHDRNLLQLMQRCKDKNIKLTKEKIKPRSKEVPFMGHVITSEGLKQIRKRLEQFKKCQHQPT